MSDQVQARQTVQVVCPHCDAANRLPAEKDARAARCGRCKEPLFTGHPVAMTGERFKKHLRSSDVPLIVDFWASWCGPCRAMAPVFDKAAETLEPKARFIKIDVDAEPALAQQFGVRGIPALFLFKDGRWPSITRGRRTSSFSPAGQGGEPLLRRAYGSQTSITAERFSWRTTRRASAIAASTSSG